MVGPGRRSGKGRGGGGGNWGGNSGREVDALANDVTPEGEQLRSGSSQGGPPKRSLHESLPEGEVDGFLELAMQLAELSRAETASHEALTKRIADLEANLSVARKEIADVRVRNERLATQLKAASAATAGADVSLAQPPPRSVDPPSSATPARLDSMARVSSSSALKGPAALLMIWMTQKYLEMMVVCTSSAWSSLLGCSSHRTVPQVHDGTW